MVSYDFTNFVKTYGGTAALEFQPDSHWYSSLLVYDYRQTEDQTDPIFTLRAFDQLKNQTQHGGTLRVPDVRTALNYDRFETESRGVLFKTRYTDDNGTEVALLQRQQLPRFRTSRGLSGQADQPVHHL